MIISDMNYEDFTKTIDDWGVKQAAGEVSCRPLRDWDFGNGFFPPDFSPFPGEESSDEDWLIMYQDWYFVHVGMQWDDDGDCARILISTRNDRSIAWDTREAQNVSDADDLRRLLESLIEEVREPTEPGEFFYLAKLDLVILRKLRDFLKTVINSRTWSEDELMFLTAFLQIAESAPDPQSEPEVVVGDDPADEKRWFWEWRPLIEIAGVISSDFTKTHLEINRNLILLEWENMLFTSWSVQRNHDLIGKNMNETLPVWEMMEETIQCAGAQSAFDVHVFGTETRDRSECSIQPDHSQ